MADGDRLKGAPTFSRLGWSGRRKKFQGEKCQERPGSWIKAKGGSLRSADFQSAWTVGANESAREKRTFDVRRSTFAFPRSPQSKIDNRKSSIVNRSPPHARRQRQRRSPQRPRPHPRRALDVRRRPVDRDPEGQALHDRRRHRPTFRKFTSRPTPCLPRRRTTSFSHSHPAAPASRSSLMAQEKALDLSSPALTARPRRRRLPPM